MKFDLLPAKGQAAVIQIEPEAIIVAGFTARDPAKVQAHIQELAREGVAAPASVPTFYVVPPTNLVQTNAIVTAHHHTSGEVEIALLVNGNDTYVTVASDHTDRMAEALDIGLSKLACPKILATAVWPTADLVNHWDDLILRSWLEENGERRLYQEGQAGLLLPPEALVQQIPFRHRPTSYVLLMGTLSAIGGVRGSGRFWAELHDPQHERTLHLDYRIHHLGQLLEPAI